MIIHVCGNLGSGKTIWCTDKIINSLVFSDKDIYTNIRLVDYWDYHLTTWLCKGMKSFVKFLLSPVSKLSSYKVWLSNNYTPRYHYFSDLAVAVEQCFLLPNASESSRLFIWDEIHLDLNARQWKATGMSMINFFSMSRKLGFDIIMTSQLKSAVDRQMRDLADVSYKMKNLRNFRPLGIPIIPFNAGLLTKRWANRGAEEKDSVLIGAGIVRYNSYVKNFYDTRQLLTEKSLPPPLLWSENKRITACDDCIYLKYYYNYSDFIDKFYPGREYQKSAPLRLFHFPDVKKDTNAGGNGNGKTPSCRAVTTLPDRVLNNIM